jgi:threonine dehydratase
MKSLSGGTRIIGVQTAAAPSAYVSFKDEKILERAARATIADGIAVGRVGERPFEIIRRYVDDMVLVEDDDVAMSILLFLERKKLVVEGAGAATLAALLANKQMFEGRRVVVVVSGGNIDFTLIDRIIHKGLVISGRIGVFDVTVEDIPGRLQSLAKIIADRKGNILNVVHDRLSPDLPVVMTRVIFTVETKGKGHLQEILSALNENGFDWRKKEGM